MVHVQLQDSDDDKSTEDTSTNEMKSHKKG